MSKVSTAIALVVGAAIGSVVTWKVLEKKYENLVKEEIASVKKELGRMSDDEAKQPEESEQVKGQMGFEDLDEEDSEYFVVEDRSMLREQHREVLKEQGYTNYSGIEKEKNEPQIIMEPRPYVISPSEFGEGEYDTVSYTLYADGTLADDLDDPVIDVDDVVGKESLEHFGEYEDDSVFVRNDRLKLDFEILLDDRKYSDVYNIDPRQAED